MEITVEILNYSYSGSDEYIAEHCSGCSEEHSDRVKELLTKKHGDIDDHDCEAGKFVTIVDGEVVEESEFVGFRVTCTDEPDDSPLGLIESGDLDDYEDLLGGDYGGKVNV